MAQVTVTEHLRILKDAGIVKGTIDYPRTSYTLGPLGDDKGPDGSRLSPSTGKRRNHLLSAPDCTSKEIIRLNTKIAAG